MLTDCAHVMQVIRWVATQWKYLASLVGVWVQPEHEGHPLTLPVALGDNRNVTNMHTNPCNTSRR